jgi:hypothetical protein
MASRLIGAGLGALAALVTTLASPPPTQAAWHANARTLSAPALWRVGGDRAVWMVGDSITAADAPALAEDLAARGRTLAVDATPGIPTTPGVDRLLARLRRAPAPPTLVVALGTNDGEPRVVAAQVERVMRAVPRRTQVWWVNVWKDRWLVPDNGDVLAARRINAGLDAATRRHHNLAVVDWWSAAAADPRHYLRDGVHTSAAGRAARNALVVAAVERDQPPAPAQQP